MTDPTLVDTHKLPDVFVRSIKSGQWQSARASSVNLGLLHPEDICFFSLDQIRVVTNDLHEIASSEDADIYHLFSSDRAIERAGWLNVNYAVVIGGGRSEEMLCLEYSKPNGPRVACQDCETLRWRIVYESVDEFLDDLGAI